MYRVGSLEVCHCVVRSGYVCVGVGGCIPLFEESFDTVIRNSKDMQYRTL